MAEKSTIEWTNSTWNPVTGCDKISAGCAHCYAERFAERFRGVPGHPFKQGFDLKLWPERLELPLTWKNPKVIFVNSMSDLFHKDIPLKFIQKTYEVMKQAHWHTFQVLTKRAERLGELSPKLSWAPNIWMGVSVESDRFTYRIDHLRKTNAHVKFLSLEPLLGPLPSLNLKKIDWAIVGGESGPGARPMDGSWVLEIKKQCQKAKVPFFFKQWGGVWKKRNGRILQGRTWDQMPKTPKIALKA
ncbi:MAG TPA: phage Gp37/Gp68 family protein [bacterium]|nr:phage Gp37/Gp68 family protein [bacterium]